VVIDKVCWLRSDGRFDKRSLWFDKLLLWFDKRLLSLSKYTNRLSKRPLVADSGAFDRLRHRCHVSAYFVDHFLIFYIPRHFYSHIVK
jgi:hypothetical protein